MKNTFLLVLLATVMVFSTGCVHRTVYVAVPNSPPPVMRASTPLPQPTPAVLPIPLQRRQVVSGSSVTVGTPAATVTVLPARQLDDTTTVEVLSPPTTTVEVVSPQQTTTVEVLSPPTTTMVSPAVVAPFNPPVATQYVEPYYYGNTYAEPYTYGYDGGYYYGGGYGGTIVFGRGFSPFWPIRAIIDGGHGGSHYAGPYHSGYHGGGYSGGHGWGAPNGGHGGSYGGGHSGSYGGGGHGGGHR